MPLTQIVVKNAKATGSAPIMLGDGGGLYLRVSPTGAKSWVLRYQKGKRRHDMGLGSADLVTLAEARKAAHEQRRLLHIEGRDPLTTKRFGQGMTFEQAVDAYTVAKRAGWSAGHAAGIEQMLRKYALPKIGAMTVGDVDTRAVEQVLRPIWNTMAVTADRLRANIANVLDYAKTVGYREGDNPARWDGHLENIFPAVRKVAPKVSHAALDYKQLPAFMAELRAREESIARALEFLILTGTRASETLDASWSEFDLDAKTWTIPKKRMKSRREHKVPLTGAMLDLLAQMPRLGPYVFTGDRTFDEGVLLKFVQRKMKHTDITVHGLRSSFADWAAERAGHYPFEVREAALAHEVRGATERSYSRTDYFERRRELMDEWSRFCTTPEPVGDNIVALRSA